MSVRLALFLILALLSGCITAYKYDLAYAPDPFAHAPLPAQTFSVSVTDARPYVTHGEKYPFFLGIVRDTYGFPRDVVTRNKTALARQLETDLSSELETLGLVRSSSPSRLIKIRLRDWNFDTGAHTRFWYDLDLTVTDATGKSLLTKQIKNERTFETNVFDTSRELNKLFPNQYTHFIREVVSDNKEMLTALQQAS